MSVYRASSMLLEHRSSVASYTKYLETNFSGNSINCDSDKMAGDARKIMNLKADCDDGIRSMNTIIDRYNRMKKPDSSDRAEYKKAVAYKAEFFSYKEKFKNLGKLYIDIPKMFISFDQEAAKSMPKTLKRTSTISNPSMSPSTGDGLQHRPLTLFKHSAASDSPLLANTDVNSATTMEISLSEPPHSEAIIIIADSGLAISDRIESLRVLYNIDEDIPDAALEYLLNHSLGTNNLDPGNTLKAFVNNIDNAKDIYAPMRNIYQSINNRFTDHPDKNLTATTMKHLGLFGDISESMSST